MRKAYRRRLQALTGAVQAVSGQREGVADSDTLQDFITVIAKSKDTKSCLYVTDQTGGFGANGLAGVNGSVVAGLIVEVILTFIFVTAIFGATEKEGDSHVAGIVIGLSLTLVHLLGIAYTGTSVNPARSLGPAILVGGAALSSVWVFIVGPLVGGAAAALVWRFLHPAE